MLTVDCFSCYVHSDSTFGDTILHQGRHAAPLSTGARAKIMDVLGGNAKSRNDCCNARFEGLEGTRGKQRKGSAKGARKGSAQETSTGVLAGARCGRR